MDCDENSLKISIILFKSIACRTLLLGVFLFTIVNKFIFINNLFCIRRFNKIKSSIFGHILNM